MVGCWGARARRRCFHELSNDGALRLWDHGGLCLAREAILWRILEGP
jgi:hypothetical protein